MTEFQDFIKQVFKEQYEASFGSARLEELEPKDYYLTCSAGVGKHPYQGFGGG